MFKEINALYIHFPFCLHLCNYCDFYKHKLESTNQIIEYESFLSKQWEEHKKFLSTQKTSLGSLETLYIGGGTPSLWGKEGIKFFKSFLKKEVTLKKNCEFTLEVDPGTISKEDLLSWMKLGVNRFSIGVQSFDDNYLDILDRKHKRKEIIHTLSLLKELNANFSVDLLLGIPSSMSRNVLDEIEELCTFSPKHFSLYILKARKNYPLKSKLLSDELVREEYLGVCKYLEEKGFEQYEVANFGKKNFWSKHNLQYWSYNSVAGLGANATGLLVGEDAALRYQWKSKSIGFQTEDLSDTSLMIEKLYMFLRHHKGLVVSELFPNKSFERLFSKWTAQGYLTIKSTHEHILLNSLGYLMCDSIIDDIFKEIDF